MRVTNYYQDDGDNMYDLELSPIELRVWLATPDAVTISGSLTVRQWYDRHSSGTDIFDTMNPGEGDIPLPEDPIPMDMTRHIDWQRTLSPGETIEWYELIDAAIEEFDTLHAIACAKRNMVKLADDALREAINAHINVVNTGGKPPAIEVPSFTSVPEADQWLDTLIKEDS